MTTQDTPVISLIIVTWNSWNDLNRCLHSIYASEFSDLEVIVIDNASIDNTCDELRSRYPAVILHENPTNEGHTKGVNRGFGMAKGEYLMVLDADTELPANTIGGMIEFMRSNPDASLVTPRNLNTDGSVQESSRSLPTIMNGIFGRQSKLTEWYPGNRFSARYLGREYLNETKPFQVEQISAACMVFRRELLDEVGLWDERYPGYWVDTDWCAHLKHLGKKVYCVPAYEITHHENNAKGKRKSVHRIWLFHYGAYLLYTKWYSWGVLDPRSLFAAFALSVRSIVLILGNMRLPKSEGIPDHISHDSVKK